MGEFECFVMLDTSRGSCGFFAEVWDRAGDPTAPLYRTRYYPLKPDAMTAAQEWMEAEADRRRCVLVTTESRPA